MHTPPSRFAGWLLLRVCREIKLQSLLQMLLMDTDCRCRVNKPCTLGASLPCPVLRLKIRGAGWTSRAENEKLEDLPWSESNEPPCLRGTVQASDSLGANSSDSTPLAAATQVSRRDFHQTPARVVLKYPLRLVFTGAKISCGELHQSFGFMASDDRQKRPASL